MTLTPITVLLLLYSACVLALTAAEYRRDAAAQRFLKPACAFGFIVIALQSGALSTLYGQVIFAALILCAIGDIALLSRKSRALFLAGMGAFGLGHGAYVIAFFGPYGSALGIAIGAALAFGLIALFRTFIWTHIDKDMRAPVAVYIAIIGLMLITAMDYALTGGIWKVGLGAALFAVSDFFVGKDRFAAQDPRNALAITPLYFGAQALFALSTAQAL
jgi:uncharacterized membrane protein YhhN